MLVIGGMSRRKQMSHQHLISWNVGVPRSELLQRVFSESEDGRIRFGWNAWSNRSDASEDLRSWTVVHDYIMEGGVKYEMRITDDNGSSLIEVKLLGSNRDQYVVPHIEFHLKQAGLAESIEQVE